MRAQVFLLLAACLGVLAGPALVAQTLEGFDVAAAKRRAELEASDAAALADEVRTRGDVFRADAERLRASGEATLARAAAAGPPGRPAGPIDLEAMVAAAAENASAPRGDAPQLIVFASLSMPRPALRTLIADATRAGGVVVFRGFPQNSAKAFTTALVKAIGSEGGFASIGIDPRLFRAFGVERVPTIVVASSDFDLCAGFNCRTSPPPHDRVWGNVTLDYALSTIADGQGPGAGVAAVALARLRKAAS